jgi:D-glycero-D-manno-heptose 1,7-bisphosphate phosphatase
VSGRPAAFIDRDGTLIEERHYPTVTGDIVPVEGAAQALSRLEDAGWLRIVLTNQSAVARGMLTEEDLGGLHDHMLRELAGDGGAVDAIYYCPHHPEGIALGYSYACACRKPGRGLLDLALAEHDIDLSRSVFIGDSPRDLFPGVTGVGARILVVPPDAKLPDGLPEAPDHVAADFPAAVAWLLSRAGQPAQGT